MNGIGTLTEKSLHAALKQYLAQPGDRFEVRCEGYVIDIMRGQSENGLELIEIQTRSFSALKKKLANLLAEEYTVRLVHPIAAKKWICRLGQDGDIVSRRKSPKKGTSLQLFGELVYIPHLLPDERFSVEVLLTHEEEIRINDGAGSWRRQGWSIYDRRLLEVIERQRFDKPTDLLALLPEDLPEQFTTRHIATGSGQRLRIAQQMAYVLRNLSLIEQAGKQGNAYLYERVH